VTVTNFTTRVNLVEIRRRLLLRCIL